MIPIIQRYKSLLEKKCTQKISRERIKLKEKFRRKYRRYKRSLEDFFCSAKFEIEEHLNVYFYFVYKKKKKIIQNEKGKKTKLLDT
jgi:hypothetical protein